MDMALRRRALSALLAVIVGTASCGCTATIKHRADPLLGRIIRTADQKEVPRQEIFEIMAEAEVIYLGEKHDNPYHHSIQLEALQKLLRAGKRPAVGFEVFSLEQTGFLMEYSVGPPSPLPRDLDMSQEKLLRTRLGWGRERDQDWHFYFPLLQLAAEHKLPVFGADLPPGLRLRLSRVGLDGLSELERHLLHPTDFESPAYRSLMYQEFTRAHCGWSSPELLRKLYETWLA
ncbi:MAG: hypothetical protein GTN65_16955, partial [Armatimonadetes bacterium]|nr:hypothetical protein [Armatimonadota bacterium]NIO98738.1 hypothetical protein [Armatimonadota bacterium]